MRRMPRGVVEGDDGAEAHAEHDRPLDRQRVAELPDVVGPALEPSSSGLTDVAAPAAALVEVDDLGALGEPRPELDLEEQVVEARAGMEEHDGRPLPHPRPIGHELARRPRRRRAVVSPTSIRTRLHY